MTMLRTFDYKCPNCGLTKEIFSKNHNEDKPCPECGTVLKRQLTAPCFKITGEGVYSSGTFPNAHQGPKIDKELLTLSDKELNRACGLPEDCA